MALRMYIASLLIYLLYAPPLRHVTHCWPKSRVAVTRGNINYLSYPPHSVIPEITKPMGCQFGVAHRVLNIAVPEIMLNGAGIDAFVGEVKLDNQVFCS
jgi:hypothetical protein